MSRHMNRANGYDTPQRGKHFRVEQPQGSDRHAGMGPLRLLLAALLVVGVTLSCGALAHRMLVRPASPELPEAEETPKTAEPVVDEHLSGWVVGDDGVSRYYDPATHVLYRGWLEEGDSTLYFDGVSGEPSVGWLELDGRWYWFDDGTRGTIGAILKDQWFTDEVGEHYLCSDGSAAIGWKLIDDSWYFFDDQGALQTGWIDDGSGKRYWVRPEDKTLPHHEWIEIDGVFEPFDDDGSWVNNGEVMPPNDAENVASMTERQQAVIDACDITPWPGRGYCAAWVSDVFVNAGEPAVYGDACDIARAWCTSDDLSELKPGMVIAVTTHERTENGLIWGHVCIYAGNGLVRDSGATSTRWVTLGSWFAWYGTLESPHWGWANGIALDEW